MTRDTQDEARLEPLPRMRAKARARTAEARKEAASASPAPLSRILTGRSLLLQEWGAEHLIHELIFRLGDDGDREGVAETPARVIKSWSTLFGGYGADPASVMKTFKQDCDEMVVLRDIEFYSTCEHHMLPFYGKAHVGYLPSGEVVGISKLARLIEIYARRLQIQERIGQQVTEALMLHLKPRGCGVVLEAQHGCMTCRGVGKQNSVMVTSSMRGAFRDDYKARDEFLRMIGK